MKARTVIIALVFSVSIYVAAGKDAVGDELKEGTFGKYFEPYEPNVEPNAPGYTLPLDLDNIINLADAEKVTDVETISDNLRQNGFAIIEPRGLVWDDIVKPYEYFSSRGIPIFLTTDTLLHLYHIQFDETLKDIEEREFIPDINNLTVVLLNEAIGLYEQLQGDLKEAAMRNVAYLSVARKLIDPNAIVPELVAETVANELALIEAHQGFAESPLFIYEEDYSQYVPRGHYTRSEPLKRYFKTMMWYGRMAFLLKGSIPWGQNAKALISPYDAKIQTLQAILLAASLQSLQVGDRLGLQVWDRIYSVTAFYVGLADDLTPYDYLWALDQVFGGDFVLNDLANDDNLLALKTELALLPSPKIFGGTGNAAVPTDAPPEFIVEILDKSSGLRLMGQRFIPDSYMFQNLVFPKVDEHTGDPQSWPFTKAISTLVPGLEQRYVRGYPRGLDVMALFGSNQALHILIDEGDTDYIGFWRQFDEMKYEFDAFTVDDWNQNLYWSWLYSLKALVTDFPQGYPNFMQTAAWQKKSLNATLASWSELRHDTILYAKQSYTPSRGLWSYHPPPPPPPPPPPGYIEPALEFYGRLLALTRMTSAGLTDMKVLSLQAAWRLIRLGDLLERMLVITERELLNQPLTQLDALFIDSLPESLESIVTGVGQVGIKTTLVADVHTNVAEAHVLEEAVGNIDLIVVACPNADGSVFLAVGPVLSYYEFKHPMSDRLTDEAWRELLNSPDRPERPTWFQSLKDY
jgi:hypothetical protein